MKYGNINSSLFNLNRNNFNKELKPGSIALFFSNYEGVKSADQHHKFKQDADLFYLSGIDQEDTILILFPDCPVKEWREILFIKETNDEIAIWEGAKFTKEQATKTSGIQSILWYHDFEKAIQPIINLADNIYVNLNENDRFGNNTPYQNFDRTHWLKNKYPGHNFFRSTRILSKLRTVKSSLEIELIQKACDITETAFRRVLEFTKPGVFEHEIEAEIIHEFISKRATGHAYEPIIASGFNACVLHYLDNNKECKDGDVMLMDFGAEYANYCADLSRSIPINGQYTQRQKDVYNAVLRVQNGAMELLKPGKTLPIYHTEVGELMTEELLKLDLITSKEVRDQNPKAPVYKKYFMHGTSHHLGIDVHDLFNRYGEFEVGNVLTVEPGIYIREENLGIRIENDIVLTPNGFDDLMKNIPREIEEIEELMN